MADNLLQTLKKKATDAIAKKATYNYKVGEKDSGGSGIPFNVKLSMDADFNKAVTKWVWIGSGGIALGIFAGFALTRRNNKNK